MFDRNRDDRPRTAPEFEHISHFWDAKHGTWSAKILPGEYYVSDNDEIITTVLGSCVAACIYDPERRVGGMNHFMLPEQNQIAESKDTFSAVARYGVFAMEHLVNQFLRGGTRKQKLELKLFGGAKMLGPRSDIGRQNIEFVQQYARAEQLNVLSQDLGGTHGRKFNFFANSGRVLVKRLQGTQDKEVADRERSYKRRVTQTRSTGEVELF